MTSIRLAPLAAVVCFLLLGACSYTIDATRLGVRATLAEPAAAPAEGAAFKISKRAVYMFWGIVAAARPDIESVLAGQLIDGAGVADLRIRVRSRWNDVLITVLTGGLVVPRSVTFEGVVVER